MSASHEDLLRRIEDGVESLRRESESRVAEVEEVRRSVQRVEQQVRVVEHHLFRGNGDSISSRLKALEILVHNQRMPRIAWLVVAGLVVAILALVLQPAELRALLEALV